MRLRFVVAVAFFLALVTTAVFARPPGPPPGGGGGGRSEFEISGSVDPVYPAVQAELVLKVENPENFTIVVTALTVEVGDASPECDASNLLIDPIVVPIEIEAQGETTVSAGVSLNPNVPNACQQVEFPLEFSGVAERP